MFRVLQSEVSAKQRNSNWRKRGSARWRWIPLVYSRHNREQFFCSGVCPSTRDDHPLCVTEIFDGKWL